MKTFLIAAITVDGFIGQNATDVSTRWTSKEDANWFSQRTKQAEFCVMGRKTYETFNRPLPDRIVVVQTRDPKAFQVNQKKLGHQIWSVSADVDVIKSQLKLSKTQVWASDLNPSSLSNLLQQAGAKELAICGGASIYTQWFRADLVDEIYLTVEPVLFGAGVKLFNDDLGEVKLKVISQKQLNEKGTRLYQCKI